jgi:hypothetical protein
MTISERINLHRCGYSRAEIDALAAAEKEEAAAEQATTAEPAEDQDAEPEAQEQTQPAQDQAAAGNREILDAINNLTAALQARNVNTQQQPENAPQTMNDLINIL